MSIQERVSWRASFFAMVAGGLLALSTVPAQAGNVVGVGQDPPPPLGPFVGDDEQNDMIMVGSISQPVPITVDETPGAPPWRKQFVINRDGQGWASAGPGSMVTVMEVIQILPSPTQTQPIRDWHEDIDPSVGDGANFKWAGGIIEVLAPGLGAFPGMVSADGKSIWFDFPPLPVPAVIKITKDLMWNGNTITPGQIGENNYVVSVIERPSVPEPATWTLALLGTALGAVAVRRSRARRQGGSA